MKRLITVRSWVFPLFLLAACGGDDTKKPTDAARDLGDARDATPTLEVLPDTSGTGPDTLAPADTARLDVRTDTFVPPVDTGLPPVDAPLDAPVDTLPPDARTPDAGTDVSSNVDTAPRLDVASPDTAQPDVANDGPATDANAADLTPDTLVATSDATDATDTTAPGPDTQPSDAVAADANPALLPQLSGMNPSSGTTGVTFALTLSGSNFATGAQAYFDGQAIPTTVTSATQLTAQVGSSLTATPGQHAITVRSATGENSNTLYFTVSALAGAPVLVDYNPDNGVVGDTILLVGRNLTGITITGPGGLTATAGDAGVISWLEENLQSIEFVIPTGWQTGAITVTNTQGSSRGKVFNVGQNLARLTGVTLGASSEYSSSWPKGKGADNNLATSWFTEVGDCATDTTCTTVPWYTVTFPSAQTISRIALRGNREYESGYDFIRGKLEILAAGGGVLWTGAFTLPEPERDLDILLPTPVAGAVTVRFTSLQDESREPGFAELEIF